MNIESVGFDKKTNEPDIWICLAGNEEFRITKEKKVFVDGFTYALSIKDKTQNEKEFVIKVKIKDIYELLPVMFKSRCENLDEVKSEIENYLSK